MYTPDLTFYDGLMDYPTFKAWVTKFYTNGTPWKSEINWRHAIDAYYENKPSARSWTKHVENGGSQWTLFNNEGWQMTPHDSKAWKNRIQSRVRRMIHADQFEMNLHRANLDTVSDSESTETPEEEYWKKTD